MRQCTYRPVGLCKLQAGLDQQGELVGLQMRIAAPSILASAAPNRLDKDGRDLAAFQGLNPSGAEGRFGYAIPNLLIEHAIRNTHVPVGFWRGVNTNQNAIWLELFIDEIAHAAGKDPLELRRKLLVNSPKHLAVLNAVAERIAWGTPPPPGVHRGIAQFMGYGSYCAGQLRLPSTTAASSKSIVWSLQSTAAMRSIRSRWRCKPRAPLRSAWARCSTRNAPSKMAAWCKRIWTPIP